MVTDRKIYVTQFDQDRLTALIDGIRENPVKAKADLAMLEKELERAVLVDSKNIPADVITMNSRVQVRDLKSGEESFFTLVFPPDANIEEKKISILAPIGTALLGYRVGDTIEWQVPGGVKKLQVLSVLYQPEAAGDYHL